MLRIAQIMIGLVFVFVSSRLIHGLEGNAKLIAATLLAVLLGYYFVLTNIYIMKRSGELSKAFDRRLEPHRAGHAVLLISSVILGYGYSGNYKPIIWLGLGGIFLANYLLTIVRSLFEEMQMEARKEYQTRKTKDIEIKVSTSTSSKYHYLLTAKNNSDITIENIRIFYEPSILDAESFGIDTTHMPEKDASVRDDPIFIDSLNEKESITFERKGWGSHEAYSGPKHFAMELGFIVNGETPERKDRKWCLAHMRLPNARNE